jgi:septum site-determining protein MinC
MKTRGTRGGILLSLDKGDSLAETLNKLESHRAVLTDKVILEVSERLSWGVIRAVADKIGEFGGELTEVRPPGVVVSARGETVILAKTVRSGGRVESSASVIILGDVNAGAEIIAEDDIIVVGTLRGVAHAGASGNEKAVIWAQRILSPQLRIAGALAQAGGERPEGSGAEVAQLHNGQIILRPWDR